MTDFNSLKASLEEETLDLTKYNKCVIYLLPLLELEIKDFDGGLINAFCKEKKREIYVETTTDFSTIGTVLTNPNYKKLIPNKDKDTIYIVYKMPDKFTKEFDLFLQSSVSKFSSEAKDIIKLSNGLCQKENGQIYLYHPADSYEYELILSFFNKYKGQTNTINTLWTKRCEQVGFELPEDVELMEKVDLEKELV